jgi:hypothetical protein
LDTPTLPTVARRSRRLVSEDDRRPLHLIVDNARLCRLRPGYSNDVSAVDRSSPILPHRRSEHLRTQRTLCVPLVAVQRIISATTVGIENEPVGADALTAAPQKWSRGPKANDPTLLPAPLPMK